MPRMMIIANYLNEKQPAIERGMKLAQRRGYTVEVVGFCYESLAAQGITGKSQQAEARRRILEAHGQKLEQLVSAKQLPGLQVSVKSVWEKEIRNWVVRQCERRDYAVVVKTGHRSETFVYSSTDWHLLRECPAPLMIVCDRQWRKTRPLLATLDLASRSRVKQALNRKVIETAKAYAAVMDCELHLIHAIHISPLLTELDLVDEHSHALDIKESLTPVVERLCQEYELSPKQFRLKRGPVEKVIASEAARLRAQLVVMGTVGRRGVKARLLGNTAEHVLSRLRTDVLAIKP
ncbi:universal stress protein UspA [Halieaceae bacterium IMCC14734]|uniref:Universal stress protein UspA n=1 Tax=Candidatus Litorirhabdus singularis TaxID=2518993 RepID=A0ABT3TH23_9GAMM|nr:universal stress protein [Candidatus Litorirhabdus singularis]MCX2981576.1 universal stress protein UspA [Candidatus Litorirhabdus singularis]